MKKSIKILCTVGPSSLNAKCIKQLDQMGVDIFRVNLSHTTQDDIEPNIQKILQSTSKPLCIDLEGAQIRNGHMKGGQIFYQVGDKVKIYRAPVLGDQNNLSLAPEVAFEEIAVGDLISIDFDTLLLKVEEKCESHLVGYVVSGGIVGNNKAVTVDRDIHLPPLSPKDQYAIEVALKYNIPYVALSFANRKSDVIQLRDLVASKMKIISKIESKEGVRNLDEILGLSDACLLDRGDLSREISIEMIPLLQKKIIQRSNELGRPTYVATNLLESMVNRKIPTRAEVNDIANTLADGADGLVLAAETAIGDYPVECVKMVRRLINVFELSTEQKTIGNILKHSDAHLQFVQPYGGQLINRMKYDVDRNMIKGLRSLFVDETVLFDAEQIGTGGYSPLEGFMTRDEIHSVLDHYRLPNGVIWTLPIVLQASGEKLKDFRAGDQIALVSPKDNQAYAILHLEDIYAFNFEDIAKGWFKTDDSNHPGVQRLRTSGEYFLGGKIDLIKRIDTPHRRFTLTPSQTRHVFEKKGWNTIAGFHTRNVIHRAHEYLQLSALDKYHIDGLFVHPVIGPKKESDFSADIILKSYSLMMEKYYTCNTFLAGLLSYSRYAGPREAVFTAICRKNYGCTHFIVGRDHTGVAGFYQPDESRRLFDAVGDIGIRIIFFDEVYYCSKCKLYTENCDHGRAEALYISGSEARKLIRSGQYPPEWFMRPDISKLIFDWLDKEKEVFVR